MAERNSFDGLPPGWTPVSVPADEGFPQPQAAPEQQFAKVEQQFAKVTPYKKPIGGLKREEKKGKELVKPKRLTTLQLGVDASLSKTDWEAVLEAYSKTGLPKEISAATKVSLKKVTHLINIGCQRLSLPSIKEFAVKRGAISRSQLGRLANETEKDYEKDYGVIQEAATQRAGMENAAAMSLMNTSLKAATIMQGYLTKLMDKLEREGGAAFEETEKITISQLRSVVKAAGDLAHTVDLASQITRRVAGQPERNLALEIANAVCVLPREAMEIYLHTGELPRDLRLLKTSQLAEAVARGQEARTEIQQLKLRGTVIDAESTSVPPTAPVEIMSTFGTEADPLFGTYPEEEMQAKTGEASGSKQPEERILEEDAESKREREAG